MKEKTEVFKLDMATDDFTEQTLDAIVAQFKQLGIPVQWTIVATIRNLWQVKKIPLFQAGLYQQVLVQKLLVQH